MNIKKRIKRQRLALGLIDQYHEAIVKQLNRYIANDQDIHKYPILLYHFFSSVFPPEVRPTFELFELLNSTIRDIALNQFHCITVIYTKGDALSDDAVKNAIAFKQHRFFHFIEFYVTNNRIYYKQ
jgi:hypothetical protein